MDIRIRFESLRFFIWFRCWSITYSGKLRPLVWASLISSNLEIWILLLIWISSDNFLYMDLWVTSFIFLFMRPSRRFREEKLVRRNQQVQRPVRRSLEIQESQGPVNSSSTVIPSDPVAESGDEGVVRAARPETQKNRGGGGFTLGRENGNQYLVSFIRQTIRYLLAVTVGCGLVYRWFVRKLLGSDGFTVLQRIFLIHNFGYPVLWPVVNFLALKFSLIWGNHWERCQEQIESYMAGNIGLDRRLIPFMVNLKSRYRIGFCLCHEQKLCPEFVQSMDNGGIRTVSDSNLHRPSRRFREEDLVRRNSHERRPVRRNLEFQDSAIPASENEYRSVTVDHGNHGNDREFRGIDRTFNGNGGFGGLALGRGNGRAGAGLRGRRDSFWGGSRSGQSSGSRRKDGGDGSNGLPRNSCLVSANINSAIPVIAEAVGDESVKPGGTENNKDVVLSVINSRTTYASGLNDPAKNDDVLIEEEQVEDGEFNMIGEDDIFNGNFPEFDGELEFGVGEDFGNGIEEDEMHLQEDAMTGQFVNLDNDGDEVIPIEEETMGSLVAEKIPISEGTEKADFEITAIDSKSGVGVKDVGKDKYGKVALPKLPGRP